jgi:hypothetical protein
MESHDWVIVIGKPEKKHGENLSQCCFVDHKYDIDDQGANPGPRSKRPVTNRLSHGTAL